MRHKVHRIDVNRHNMQEKLELFLNRFNGEIVSVIPNVKPVFRPMGATARVDYILIIEKTH
ncbi:MAG: hypothetical protein HKO94_10935 [Flavobacteriaceae bacterium]|nr:hypothetical protein [Flavobacteriaceae bacterium]